MSKIIDKGILTFGRLLCKKRKHKPFSTVGQIFRSLAYLFENHNYDINTNGEKRVIDILAKFHPKLIIDAGANIGDYTLLVAKSFDEVNVYAFEIAPQTFNTLVDRCGRLRNVEVFNLGLDQESGTVELILVNEKHGSNSVYPRDLKKLKVEGSVKCKVTTLDKFLLEKKVKEVDYLKIDTEGMDFRVLKGAHQYLSEGAISVIQFEYGMVAVDTRFLLKDFYELFQQYGYVVGKIYPTYVDFREYHRSMEDFIGPNFLAVRKDLVEYIQAFANFQIDVS